ncbi:DUF445 domain-containing protein [Iodidimonas sp. SYSU 1G8]|uniref:DUF445 domain-containing protein n=1 Tax=Iodidimonas sp. SYSU 1G8 TaxID=3133967 RepID=UPI0031FF447A
MNASSPDPTLDWEHTQRRALTRYRMGATLLLLAMAAIYLATLFWPAGGFWAGLVHNGAEAAMVGGLADWFAVTALFRHPLGIPIPHTAILPNNKDRIGEGLGAFVERHFLDPDTVAGKLRSVNVASRLGRWLSDPAVARGLADKIVGAIPRLMATVGDAEVRGFFQRALSRQLESLNLPVVLGNVLALLRDSDQHHALLDQSLAVARRYLEDHGDTIYDQVDARSKWWIPRSVDRKVATAIISGVTEFLGDLSGRDHEVRRQFDQAVDKLIENLRTRPATQEQVRRLAAQILDSDATQDYLANLWRHISQQIADSSGPEAESLRVTVADGLQSIGRTLVETPDMRDRFNSWLDEAVRTGIVPFRREIGTFITDVVRGWDPKTLTERAELAVGRDLQFIRVNGTLVGGLVGCALYLLSLLAA